MAATDLTRQEISIPQELMQIQQLAHELSQATDLSELLPLISKFFYVKSDKKISIIMQDSCLFPLWKKLIISHSTILADSDIIETAQKHLPNIHPLYQLEGLYHFTLYTAHLEPEDPQAIAQLNQACDQGCIPAVITQGKRLSKKLLIAEDQAIDIESWELQLRQLANLLLAPGFIIAGQIYVNMAIYLRKTTDPQKHSIVEQGKREEQVYELFKKGILYLEASFQLIDESKDQIRYAYGYDDIEEAIQINDLVLFNDCEESLAKYIWSIVTKFRVDAGIQLKPSFLRHEKNVEFAQSTIDAYRSGLSIYQDRVQKIHTPQICSIFKIIQKNKASMDKENLRSAKRQRVSADATAFRERSKVDLAKKKQAQQDIQAAATGFIDKVNL